MYHDTWGDIRLLGIAPPMTGPEVEGIRRTAEGGGLRMWPNQNRGDQLWVNLDGSGEGVETVAVDLYDLSGKRIAARVLPTQGGHLNTVIDLNGDLAGGMHAVHETAGVRTYIERLVVQPQRHIGLDWGGAVPEGPAPSSLPLSHITAGSGPQ